MQNAQTAQTLTETVRATRLARFAEVYANNMAQALARGNADWAKIWNRNAVANYAGRVAQYATAESAGQLWQKAASEYMRGLLTMDELMAAMQVLAAQGKTPAFFEEMAATCPSRNMAEKMATAWKAWNEFVAEMAAK